MELRQLGGALSSTPVVEDAVVGRDATFSLFVVSAPLPHLFAEVVPAAARAVFAAMGTRSAGAVTPNFAGALNAREQLDASRDSGELARLHDVWRTYDPTGAFTGLPG